MSGKWNAPVDEDCPEVREYMDDLYGDPMGEAMGAPLGEFAEDFRSKHMATCKRCQEYGVENIDVIY